MSNQLTSQKHLFALPADVHYINCATRGPFSQTVAMAGHEAIDRQMNPFGLPPDAFFSGAVKVRELFSQLINAGDPDRIAVISSVSYGMAIVARNLHRKPGIRAGQHILQIDAEFPSDVYAWDRVTTELGLTIKTVTMPHVPEGESVSARWNEAMLAAIGPDTAMVVVPHVHWMYGNRFDLEAIGERARSVGAWLVVDGTQSVGALPFDVAAIQPDALVCAAYKWMMGPYSTGLAYFGEAFDGGVPVEESWMNRLDSNQFHRLTDYQPAYREKAYRYNMGEHSHFTHMPMLEIALTQLIHWQPERIQTYCAGLLDNYLPELTALGCRIEPASGRGNHLVGVWLPETADPMAVQQVLQQNRVSVSARGRALRVAPNVYNEPADMAALTEALSGCLF